jgi:hypothetical protein
MLAFCFILPDSIAIASSTLLFFEGQMVGGYTSADKDYILYSMEQKDVMQKPGAGFDFLQKISATGGDIATIAIQGRLCYDESYEHRMEPQLYNAYIKAKPPVVDLWLGHSRPAFGISNYLDSHALLLPTLAMRGFGYDRDWGGGLIKEYSRGELQISLTTGTGMPIYFKGNYLASTRLSFGILSQDNFTIGFSGAYGDVLDTMGYELMMDHPVELRLAGMDFTYLINNFEIRIEGMTGTRGKETTHAVFGRFGVNLMEENRLKVEFQPMYTITGDRSNYELSGCVTFAATGDIAFRAIYMYNHEMDDHRVIGQAYYYTKVL